MSSVEIVQAEAKKAIHGMHGWCSDEKSDKLVELIVNEKLETLCEIGVFAGKSVVPQALALKANGKGVIFGIDPWQNDAALEEMIHEDNKKWWSNLDLEDIYRHCIASLERNGVLQYCRLIRNKSENIVDQFADNSIDLLHIDGNHSEALSYKDATLYLPKVKPNGFIVFDDIWWTEEDNYVTTRKAILYLLESCDKVDIVNNDCLILKKRVI